MARSLLFQVSLFVGISTASALSFPLGSSIWSGKDIYAEDRVGKTEAKCDSELEVATAKGSDGQETVQFKKWTFACKTSKGALYDYDVKIGTLYPKSGKLYSKLAQGGLVSLGKYFPQFIGFNFPLEPAAPSENLALDVRIASPGADPIDNVKEVGINLLAYRFATASGEDEVVSLFAGTMKRK